MRETPYVLGWSEPGATEQVRRVLRAGGVLALPTETLYGFSCLAHSEIGIRRIMEMKGIRERRGFVALVGDVRAVRREVHPDQDARALEFLARVWPAPLTAVLRLSSPVAWGTTLNGRHTAAFRVPDHEPLRLLLEDLGEPVLSTSLNRSGGIPLVRPEEILQEFGDLIDLLIQDDVDPVRHAADQERESRVASCLADFTVWPPQVLRPGAYDLETVLAQGPSS